MTPRHAGCGVVVLACLAAAPMAACTGDTPQDPPKPAAALQKIVLEIDQMAGTPEIPLTVPGESGPVRLEDIFAHAGVKLEVRRDRRDLPRAPEVTLGNLHDLMIAPQARQPVAADEIGVHLIVATRETGKPADLGIMFDYGNDDTDNYPREGFAVFADVHEQFGTERNAELMLTVAHELTHVLNLHHSDWEPGRPGGTFDSGSTIESYSPARTVKWALSDRSREHLLSHPAREKWPGRGNLAFGFLLPDHFKRHQSDPAEERNRWTVIEASGLTEQGRHARAAAEHAARALPRDPSRFVGPEDALAQLTLELPRTTYEIGEPLTVTVGLHNTGASAVHVRPLLDPSYGFLQIEVQMPGSDVFLPFRPVVTREARGVRTAVLAAGERRHDEAKVFFGAGGWTFDRAGTYRIRADFPAPAPDEGAALAASTRIESPVLEITVVEPRTAAGRSARALLVGIREGLSLLIGSASERVTQAAALGASPQADAARLAVVSATVAPPPGSDVPLDVQKTLAYLARTKSAAAGPFTVAETYDQLADTLEQQGHKADASRVRQSLKERLAKTEAGGEALKRAGSRD